MFYNFLAQTKFNRYGIDNCIATIRKYNLFNNENTLKDYDFAAYENGDTIDIYYGNLHFQRKHNSTEDSLRIFIKANNEDAWVWNNNCGDWSNPMNEAFRVYSNCSLEIKNEGVFTNDVYTSGNWDKYVYKMVKKFEEKVNGITDRSRFNKYYKKM